MLATASIVNITKEDQLRADLYDYLAALLAGPPSNALLKKTMALQGDGSDLGIGFKALSRVASAQNEKSAESEFTALFKIGRASCRERV